MAEAKAVTQRGDSYTGAPPMLVTVLMLSPAETTALSQAVAFMDARNTSRGYDVPELAEILRALKSVE